MTASFWSQDANLMTASMFRPRNQSDTRERSDVDDPTSRVIQYSMIKYHYFLIDFCYYANVACFVQILVGRCKSNSVESQLASDWLSVRSSLLDAIQDTKPDQPGVHSNPDFSKCAFLNAPCATTPWWGSAG
jgi:hypothetical protein